MSNALVFQTREQVFISADSAVSVTIDGVIYRDAGTTAQKLFHVDNYIIFCSGELNYCYKLMESYRLQKDRNIDSLRNLIYQSYTDEAIDIVIAEYVGEQTRVTQLSPYYDFNPVVVTDLPVGALNVISAGIRTKEAHEISYEYLTHGNTLESIYKDTYNQISFEGIGGMLYVYKVSKNGVQLHLTHQITEPNDMRIFSIEVLKEYYHKQKKHCIVGERIYGKVFMGTKLALEDEDGVLKFQGSKGEIFNRDGTLVTKIGLVNENPDVFGLWSFNDITRVKVDDREGFVIDRATTDLNKHPDGWEKIMWADPSDGTLYTHDLVAENIKIVNDIGKTILDAENNYLDIGDFKDIVMDNKLTTLEKMQIITELYKIEAGYHRMLEQADEYIRSQRDDIFDMDAQYFTKSSSTIDLYSTTPLTNAYFDLMNYMSQYIDIVTQTPLNIDVNSPKTEQTSEIPDRAEFILIFKTYYDEEKNLRNKIEDAQFYSGLNMGQFYNNVVIGEYGFIALRNDGKYRSVLNATNGLALQKWESNRWVNKVYASIGNSQYEDGTLIAEDLVAKRLRIETKLGDVLLDADGLNFDFSVLDSIIIDDVIVSTEKITLANNHKSITKQYTTLKEQINKYVTTIYNDRDSSYYGLDDARNQLQAAGNDLTSSYNSLTTYMAPVFADMNRTTHIKNDLGSTRLEFHQKWETFYQSYESARAKLADFLEKSSLQLGRNYNNTVIDAENGIVVTRGNMMNRTTLNATEGIKIEKNIGTAGSPIWEKRFYVDLEGNLFADELSTRRLRILDGKLGDAIILDWEDGITINGQNGEQIRLNANEGIAIDVNGEPRFWVHNDGTLRAKRLIISDDDLDPIELPDGSFISKLTVNEVRTMEDRNKQDYVWVKDQFIKFISGNGTSIDEEKMALYLDNPTGSLNGIPTIKMGLGSNALNDNEVGYIIKDNDAFKINYKATNGNERRLWFNRNGVDGVILESVGDTLKLKSDKKIMLEVDSSNYIELTPQGIKLIGSRIDLN
ncbi:hypothetical protein G9G63_21115 [Paenibacillus sp. EKM202P]|uniref:hypothetical protein n=1 Tax=unclassified Paenibacillus TaxID=185978 RepID=UPI00162581C9|nr:MULTISPECIES: hypothetical protein [unclassified Paenibacillus]KAF6561251.1 hypothetical protein G9G63_21115 [Paenibacillus sp. EKM202P]KAF6566113.1 hypothetical protein G9G64_20005 [Paenibacillus sp. EKM207P]